MKKIHPLDFYFSKTAWEMERIFHIPPKEELTPFWKWIALIKVFWRLLSMDLQNGNFSKIAETSIFCKRILIHRQKKFEANAKYLLLDHFKGRWRVKSAAWFAFKEFLDNLSFCVLHHVITFRCEKGVIPTLQNKSPHLKEIYKCCKHTTSQLSFCILILITIYLNQVLTW